MKPMKKKLFSEDGFAMLGNFAPYTHLPPFWRRVLHATDQEQGHESNVPEVK